MMGEIGTWGVDKLEAGRSEEGGLPVVRYAQFHYGSRSRKLLQIVGETIKLIFTHSWLSGTAHIVSTGINQCFSLMIKLIEDQLPTTRIIDQPSKK
jgi:hypothetical protein